MKLTGQVQWKSFQVTRQIPPLRQGSGCRKIRAGIGSGLGLASSHHNHHCSGSSLSTYYRHINSSQTHREEVTIVPILQIKKPRFREEKPLAWLIQAGNRGARVHTQAIPMPRLVLCPWTQGRPCPPSSSYRKAQAALCLGLGVCLTPRLGREVRGPQRARAAGPERLILLCHSLQWELGQSASPPAIFLTRRTC